MAVKRILQIGDQRLTAKSQPLEKIDSPEFDKLVRDLKATMLKVELVGIAAAQIGVNLQVFITFPRLTKARKGVSDELRIYVNPKITYSSPEECEMYEGCGSIAQGTLFGPVKRPRIIEIEALNEKKEKFRLKTDGILARVIQHEYDHLQGILFTQIVTDAAKLMDIVYYKRFIKKSTNQKKYSKITLLKYSKI